MPVISAERFATGMSWSDYLNACTVEVERRQRGYELVQFIPEQQALLDRLGALGLKVLILEEDWCGDAARSGPVIARIAEGAGLEARWFRRDENLDIMDQYLENGGRAIPVALFMDRNYELLLRWGSRPKHVNAVRAQYLPSMPPKDDPGYQEALGRMRQATREAYEQDYPHAIAAEILEQLAAGVE